MGYPMAPFPNCRQDGQAVALGAGAERMVEKGGDGLDGLVLGKVNLPQGGLGISNSGADQYGI